MNEIGKNGARNTLHEDLRSTVQHLTGTSYHNREKVFSEFYVLLTVHLGIIFVKNQLDAQFFFMYVYFYSLHVSGSHVPIIRRINCINTTSGIYHTV